MSLKEQLLAAQSGKEVMDLCEGHGGEYVYNEPGSGEMTYSFDNSLFIEDCFVDWDEFNFEGAQIQEQ